MALKAILKVQWTWILSVSLDHMICWVPKIECSNHINNMILWTLCFEIWQLFKIISLSKLSCHEHDLTRSNDLKPEISLRRLQWSRFTFKIAKFKNYLRGVKNERSVKMTILMLSIIQLCFTEMINSKKIIEVHL